MTSYSIARYRYSPSFVRSSDKTRWRFQPRESSGRRAFSVRNIRWYLSVDVDSIPTRQESRSRTAGACRWGALPPARLSRTGQWFLVAAEEHQSTISLVDSAQQVVVCKKIIKYGQMNFWLNLTNSWIRWDLPSFLHRNSLVWWMLFCKRNMYGPVFLDTSDASPVGFKNAVWFNSFKKLCELLSLRARQPAFALMPNATSASFSQPMSVSKCWLSPIKCWVTSNSYQKYHKTMKEVSKHQEIVC